MRALLLTLVTVVLVVPALFVLPTLPAEARALHHWPATGRPQVLRPFDPPAQRWLRGHRGVDIAAADGAPVLSPADGTVTFSGRVVDRDVITVLDDTGLKHSFEPVADALPAGTRVRRGDRLAVVAAGHCAAGCVHWGVRRGTEYVDPLRLLPRPRAVLLPFAVTAADVPGPVLRPAGSPHESRPGSAGLPRPRSPPGSRPQHPTGVRAAGQPPPGRGCSSW